MYDFHRLNKVKKDLEKKERPDTNSDNRKKNKLREPLEKGEKVLVFCFTKSIDLKWNLYIFILMSQFLTIKKYLF